MGLRVLSLFDGIGCAREALHQAGVEVEEYVSYEIDKKPQRALFHNFPDSTLMGDVLEIPKEHKQRGRFDLVVAGSPCQGFSRLGKQLAYNDPRSSFYFEFEKIVDSILPDYFLLENVRMSHDHEVVINSRFGLPEKICASEVSGISRPRNYWSDICHDPLLYEGPTVSEVVDFSDSKPNTSSWHEWYFRNRESRLKKSFTREFSVYDNSKLAICQTARQVSNWNGNLVEISDRVFRHFRPSELEQLHGLPRGYTSTLSDAQAYKALGNGWSVQVVKQIFRGLK